MTSCRRIDSEGPIESSSDLVSSACSQCPSRQVKDWPSEDDFKKKLPRHYTDFIQMLPFQVGPDSPLNRLS
jgi:hypothetical protein